VHQALKRTIDISISAAAVLAAAPLLLLIAALIKLDSPGPVLFRQRRIGKHGRPFTMFKLRTMRVDADDAPHREAVRRAANGVRTPLTNGKHAFKSPDDPRATRTGKFLRTWGLDELPQLINVLRGEMSLVGPRPALEYELSHYEARHHRRFDVTPGITGLYQVHRSHAKDLHDMLDLDVEYATSASIWTDLKLIAMTIPAIVKEKGVF